MTPSQVIASLGWTTCQLRSTHGVCLIGACKIADFGVIHCASAGLYETTAFEFQKHRHMRKPFRFHIDPVSWNDRSATREQVIAFLKRVERLIRWRSSRSRSPLTTTTTATIPALTITQQTQPQTQPQFV